MSPTKRAGSTEKGRQPRRVLRSSSKPKAVHSPPAAAITQKPKHRRRRAGADPWTPRKPRKDPNPRPRAPPPTHFTCRICAEEKPTDSFPQWIPQSKFWRYASHEIPTPCLYHLSRHPRRKNDPVCKDCIGQSMSARLDTLGARNVSIGCLEPGCRTYWDFSFIMKYFPLDALEKYNLGMLNVWKEGVHFLTCLNEHCGSIGLLDTMAPGYPQVECPDCKTRMCATCNIPWHKGFTCAEYAARHINEKMTAPEKVTLELMQGKDGKRCPNCFIVIEKDGGCDSMYCMGCKTYFNWASAASAVPGAKPKPPVHPVFGGVAPFVCEVDGAQWTQHGPRAVAATG